MKKHLIIGISTVIILIATICAVTFAAWDITSASIEIGSIKVPDSVNLSVDNTITSPAANMKLVPSGIAKNDQEATIVNMGTFTLKLTSVGNATQDDLAKIVFLKLSTIDITTSVATVTDIKSRVEVLILLPDEAGVEYIVNNAAGKYKLIANDDEIIAGTAYTVAIKFVDDYSTKYNGNDAMIKDKGIKVVLNFDCSKRTTI